MFGHKNGARTLAGPTENSKRSQSKGRKGTRSSRYLLEKEIARFKAQRSKLNGNKSKWSEHMDMVYSNRINALENNLNFAS